MVRNIPNTNLNTFKCIFFLQKNFFKTPEKKGRRNFFNKNARKIPHGRIWGGPVGSLKHNFRGYILRQNRFWYQNNEFIIPTNVENLGFRSFGTFFWCLQDFWLRLFSLDKNFGFWSKFRFLMKVLILEANFNFPPKLLLSIKISFFFIFHRDF